MRPLKDLIELAKEAEKLQGMKETHKLLGRRIELLESKLAESGFGSADHGPLFPEMLIATNKEWIEKELPGYTMANSFQNGERPKTIIEGKEHVLYLSNGYIATARKLGLGVIEYSEKYNQHVLWARPCDVPRIRINDRKNRRAKR